MLFAGPLRLDFGDGHARIRFNASAGTGGGLAMCTPPPGLPTRAGSALLVAGGPLASAALALLGLGLAMLSSGLANAAAVTLAVLSAAIAVGTLLPLRAGGFVTDGGQLLALWRDDGASKERRVMASLVAHSQAGARPSRLDPELIATAAAARHDRNVATVGALLQAQAAGDRRDADAARVAFETCAQRLAAGGYAAFPHAFRKALLLPVATWLGESGTDAGRAREWLDAARGAVADAYQIAHAQAAVAHSEQRHDEAIARARQALSALRESSDRGAVLAVRESLEAIVQRSSVHRPRSTVD